MLDCVFAVKYCRLYVSCPPSREILKRLHTILRSITTVNTYEYYAFVREYFRNTHEPTDTLYWREKKP